MIIICGGFVKMVLGLAALVSAACSPVTPEFELGSVEQLIDYPLRSDRYVIVVVEEGGITPTQARKMALQRASELTLESGNLYYTIETEETTEVTKSHSTLFNAQDSMQSKVEEVAAKENAPKKTTSKRGETTLPALRITIQCYPTKPEKKSYEA